MPITAHDASGPENDRSPTRNANGNRAIIIFDKILVLSMARAS
ncbi:MAG: hypothetical protein ACTSRZ_19155 [Promethearchaeota archaeon]